MNIKQLKASFLPFVLLGITLTVSVVLLFVFFYVAVWGILVGGILWLGMLVKNYFCPKKNSIFTPKKSRIIEYDEQDK